MLALFIAKGTEHFHLDSVSLCITYALTFLVYFKEVSSKISHILSNLESTERSHNCFNYFSHCYYQGPDKKPLREDFILLSGSRGR